MTNRIALLFLIFSISAAPLVAAEQRDDAGQPVQVVSSVDLARYAGLWYELARFPHKFQEDCLSDVRATYATRDDGRVDVLNQCRTKEGLQDARGIARVADETTRAKLEVRFAPGILSVLPWVWGDYWIIGLADDYSWATVGSPDRETLWILSRTPTLDEATYAEAVRAAQRNGFDVNRLVRTKQDPDR
jgi:apolipoprotein D and lipocalin family protein